MDVFSFLKSKIRSRFEKLNEISISPRLSIKACIEDFFKEKSVFFIQIGVHDGVSNDNIHDLIIKKNNWTGIFVEPIKYLFEKLKNNYGGSSKFVFENIAIAQKNCVQKFYHIKRNVRNSFRPPLPFWYDELGSFRKSHIIKHFGPKVGPVIVEKNIDCITFDELCRRNKVCRIDFLNIDVEGYDYRILSQLDFSKYSPLAILIEYKHLSKIEKAKLAYLLKINDYTIIKYPEDLLALKI